MHRISGCCFSLCFPRGGGLCSRRCGGGEASGLEHAADYTWRGIAHAVTWFRKWFSLLFSVDEKRSLETVCKRGDLSYTLLERTPQEAEELWNLFQEVPWTVCVVTMIHEKWKRGFVRCLRNRSVWINWVKLNISFEENRWKYMQNLCKWCERIIESES